MALVSAPLTLGVAAESTSFAEPAAAAAAASVAIALVAVTSTGSSGVTSDKVGSVDIVASPCLLVF
jgi:hypothetical protein